VNRRLLRLGGLVLGALVAGYGGLLGWVYHVSREDQARPVDAIVVLGAAHYNGKPSPVLRGRLDHALSLYRQGLAPHLVVTGGTHPGDSESEAAVQRHYLLDHDVPDSVIVPLDQGSSTEESIIALGGWMHDHGLHSALLVSDGFHLGRLRIEARRLQLEAYTSPTPASAITAGSRLEWDFLAKEALKVPVAWARQVTGW
jgi:uncharacterized SAM-binding protein YcdF (DUF218 family)